MTFNPSQPRDPKGSPTGGRWVTVYHGTNTGAEKSILKHGLRPPKGTYGWEAYVKPPEARRYVPTVFVSTSKRDAMKYAHSTNWNSSGSPMVVSLRVLKNTLHGYGGGARSTSKWSDPIPAKRIIGITKFGPKS